MATITAIARVNAPTSTGTQDITTTELGGLTPKAALFFMSDGLTDDVFSADGRLAQGATDGVNEWYQGVRSENGESPAWNTAKSLRTTGLIGLIEIGSKNMESEAEFVTFLTNGIRIDWTTAGALAHKLFVVFFAGDDLEADCDIVDALGEDVGTNVTLPGFEPDVLWTGYHDKNFDAGMDDGVDDDWVMGFGVSKNPGGAGVADGVGFAHYTQDGVIAADGPKNASAVQNDRSAFVVENNPTQAYLHTVEFSDFDADGFTATARDGDAEEFGYLALKMPNTEIAIGIYEAPVSTGNDSETSLAFKPALVLFGLSFYQLAITDPPNIFGHHHTFGFSAFTETDEFSVAAQTSQDFDPSESHSQTDDRAAFIHGAQPDVHGSSDGYEADRVSLNDDGWTLDFTEVATSASKWWFFATAPFPTGQISQTELETPTTAQGQVSQTEVEIPDPNSQGQISQAEFESPFPDSQGQVSQTELEVPDADAQGQISQTELEVPNPDAQGQVSQTEVEVPEQAQGQVSQTELEVADATSGQISQTEVEIPGVAANAGISFATLETPIQQVEARLQVSQTELETSDVNDPARGQVGTAEFETPEVTPNTFGQISQTELQTKDPSAGDGEAVISFGEFELPDADALRITSVKLETTEPRRRGRIGWARMEYASVSGDNRVTIISFKDINRDKLLEELAVYGIVPDNGFFMPGYSNLEDDQRVWTPRPGAPPSPEFMEESFVSGELWFEFSFGLTADDQSNLDLVLAQHVAIQTIDEDAEDEDTEDFIVLRDYFDRWTFLTRGEKDDAICRLTRQMLRIHGGELGEGLRTLGPRTPLVTFE